MQTSGTIGLPLALAVAISKAVIKFSLASDRIAEIGNCAPVKITGLLKPLNIKLIIDAEYAIVSVP
jgi:hypothetical protein